MTRNCSKYVRRNGTQVWESWYRWDSDECEFILSRKITRGPDKGEIENRSYESPKAAENDGFKRIGHGRRMFLKAFHPYNSLTRNCK